MSAFLDDEGNEIDILTAEGQAEALEFIACKAMIAVEHMTKFDENYPEFLRVAVEAIRGIGEIHNNWSKS